MKKEIQEFKKDYFKTAIIGFFVAWLSLVIFTLFFSFTNLNVFVIFIILNIVDLYLTHTIIFKRGFNKNNEANPFVRLMMKMFNKYWFIPMFLVAVSLFYLLFFIYNPTEIVFIMMGIYLMIVINNFLILSKDKLLEKHNLEQVYKGRKNE